MSPGWAGKGGGADNVIVIWPTIRHTIWIRFNSDVTLTMNKCHIQIRNQVFSRWKITVITEVFVFKES